MDQSIFTRNIHTSFAEIKAGQWNQLLGSRNPFLCFEFFESLEKTGHLNADSGWDCRIICVYKKDQLVAALPMFAKSHSWAEFVFDWQWANAYLQHGYEYYPKLVITTPYTPANTQKFLTHPDYDRSYLVNLLISHALNYAEHGKYSSLHALFLNDEESAYWKEHDLLRRHDVQFHWNNHKISPDTDKSLQSFSFENYLERLTARKRQKIRQERKALKKENIMIEQVYAHQIKEDDWNDLYLCYANTFLQRGQAPYFRQELFRVLAISMGEKMPIFLAKRNHEIVACSICFESNDVLYGRYWGAKEDIKNLHFELCYYQTIEYALQNKLRVIEPGTGGGHKLRRGFEPTLTTSVHWIKHPGFREAIAEFLEQEKPIVEDYCNQAKQHVPYKKN